MSGYYPDGLDQAGFDRYWDRKLDDREIDNMPDVYEGYEPDLDPDEGPDVDTAYDEWLCRQFQEGENNG